MIYGGAGNDGLSGDLGNDVIFGGGGRDNIQDNWGNDEYYGGFGNDQIRLYRGSNVAEGGGGRDKFDILAGTHTATGDEGKDQFIFHSDNYDITITDFTQGDDKMKFYHVFDNFAEVKDAMTQIDDDVQIELDDALVLVQDMLIDDFTFRDFKFFG